MAGDFGQIAQYSAREAERYVRRIGISPQAEVLDVACGTGNVTIPAARAGAKVIGIDIAPNLLEQARKRTADEGLNAIFDEGDAEQLPYADGRFDYVVTMSGAMFASRPERVSAELIRVCRPGGKIIMANWTRDGFAGQTLMLGARFVPPPDGVLSPLLWGDEQVVQSRFGKGTSEIKTTGQKIWIDFPFPPQEVVQFFREYFGPTRVAFSKLESEKQAEYAAGLERLWREHNQATGHRTQVESEYLEVIAVRSEIELF
jgi:ubiquinone/menaquinone biosynthesis C-methylase UbiE